MLQDQRNLAARETTSLPQRSIAIQRAVEVLALIGAADIRSALGEVLVFAALEDSATAYQSIERRSVRMAGRDA